jgi:hypothetical protein
MLSEYDATGYYFDTIYMIATQNKIFPKINWYIADPGFHVLLYWLGKVYHHIFQINRISYLHFIYFLIFVNTITFLYMYEKLEKILSNKTVYAFFLIALLEPMMLRFSSTLEREMIVSFILLFFIFGYMNNNLITMTVCTFLLYFFRDVYLYVIPILLILQVMYEKFFTGRFLLFLFLLLFIFSLLVHVLSSVSKEMETLFFMHGKKFGESGFGDLILGTGYFLRVFMYSILGFFAPIPIYPFWGSSFSTFYILNFIMGLSSISYLFINVYIMYSLYIIDKKAFETKSLNKKDIGHYYPVFKAYFAIIVLHFIFHGLIFNVRHRLQIIPSLIFIFFHVMKIISDKSKISSNVSIGKCFLFSFAIILLLNCLYIILKLHLIFEAGIVLMCLTCLMIIILQRNFLKI